MRIFKADFVVTTPMFLGAASSGANNQPECADSIRGASVKGALRAAFRALNWSRIRLDENSDEQALRKLHDEEAAIFGSAARDKKGGQAAFLLRVRTLSKVTQQRDLPGRNGALEYLLGMGLYNFKNGMLRDHIPAETRFSLELALKPVLSQAQARQLQDCLLFWGLTGGLGSRARKGFGSVSITRLECAGVAVGLPQDVQEYKAVLRQLVGEDLATGVAPLTAFSAATRMQVSSSAPVALDLLKTHGREMAMFRGYGRNGKTLGAPAEKNFKADHDWAYDLSKRQADEQFLPRRAVFGLPHPYYLSGANFNVAVEAATGRRASPLFAHVHRFPGGKHALLHTLYKSQFLPSQVSVEVKTKGQSFKMKNVDEKIDWSVLEQFLGRFKPGKGDVIYG